MRPIPDHCGLPPRSHFIVERGCIRSYVFALRICFYKAGILRIVCFKVGIHNRGLGLTSHSILSITL